MLAHMSNNTQQLSDWQGQTPENFKAIENFVINARNSNSRCITITITKEARQTVVLDGANIEAFPGRASVATSEILSRFTIDQSLEKGGSHIALPLSLAISLLEQIEKGLKKE